MATNAAAMPQLVRRNCRRFTPSRLAFASASSLIRASTLFWVALCRGGRYSPLETIWVGIGVAAEAAAAPATGAGGAGERARAMGFLAGRQAVAEEEREGHQHEQQPESVERDGKADQAPEHAEVDGVAREAVRSALDDGGGRPVGGDVRAGSGHGNDGPGGQRQREGKHQSP